jgi:hypothetical protein
MKNRRVYAPFILCLLVIGGGVIFGACTAASAAQPVAGAQGEIETAVAATLMQYMIETKVAAEATKIFGAPAAQPTSTTSAPVATSTPLPTATPPPPSPTQAQPTAMPTASVSSLPIISAEGDTNCRRGPSTQYIIDTIFAEGSTSVVHGRDAGWDWWYIENPNTSGAFCWVWDESTVVQGDASNVPVVQAPDTSTTYTGYVSNNYYTYNPYGGFYNYPCGTFVYGVKMPKCKPKNNVCYKTNWWNCNVYNYCQCQVNWKDPCKKSGCPPITSVNFANYCDKYPKCCSD